MDAAVVVAVAGVVRSRRCGEEVAVSFQEVPAVGRG
jgi:hypothetical protein